jgi:uncharacterized protein YjiS (DUF1127 family)
MTVRTGKIGHTWFKYCAVRDKLTRMSDRDLTDIGVKRGDIHTIARHSAGLAKGGAGPAR